jgi:hypothetical protein
MILREIGGELVHELGTDDISNVNGDSHLLDPGVPTLGDESLPGFAADVDPETAAVMAATQRP